MSRLPPIPGARSPLPFSPLSPSPGSYSGGPHPTPCWLGWREATPQRPLHPADPVVRAKAGPHKASSLPSSCSPRTLNLGVSRTEQSQGTTTNQLGSDLPSSLIFCLAPPPHPPGGFLETYEALCDYNGFPFREEIQWVRVGPSLGALEILDPLCAFSPSPPLVAPSQLETLFSCPGCGHHLPSSGLPPFQPRRLQPPG